MIDRPYEDEVVRADVRRRWGDPRRKDISMGIGDFVDKAKDLAAAHPDQVDQGIDKAGDAVDERTGDKHVTQVDKAQDAVRNRLGGADEQPPA